METQTQDQTSLEKRPGILVIGSPNVGKRTLLSRLLSVDFDDAFDTSSQLLAHGWTINTKYYTADVSVWLAHLTDLFSISDLPFYDRLAALVMVFDLSDPSSLTILQNWISHIHIHKFEILLCIGNKVDLIPGHPVHVEYRRRLHKVGELSAGSFSDFNDFGISETEGTSLLAGEEPSREIRRSCLEWCTDNNIEYIEACASNTEFDKCLSIDGDSQGVERLLGALSAYMWPGMVLKSGNVINKPSLPENEELSEEESDYELEYEVLSAGSAEQWDGTYGGWVSANDATSVLEGGEPVVQNDCGVICDVESGENFDREVLQASTSTSELRDDKGPDVEENDENTEPNEVSPFDFEDLEQLMSEIGNIRGSLRLMPDFQRREMAAKLAIKMATMFGGGSDDEEVLD
uniref:Uncharacterized protein MANES_01G157000 n=2 Tax=Rhizophora mucronata TaxID=61149 RepID=A0A2P2K4I3_RHIMU